MLLEKITFDYSMQEDRICVMAQTRQGDPVLMWLTQRLCKSLASTLLGHLDKTTSVPPAADKDMMMAFQQSAAVLQQEPSAPVQTPDNTCATRIDVVDIHMAADKVELVFHLAGEDRARMVLNPAQLRQVLQIILTLFRKGDWSTAQWPSWMLDASPGVPPTTPNLSMLH